MNCLMDKHVATAGTSVVNVTASIKIYIPPPGASSCNTSLSLHNR
jgi:hypothetical protein